MEVAGLDSQQRWSSTSTTHQPSLNGSAASDPTPVRDSSQLYPDIPADVLPLILPAIIPPPAELTSCSERGLILDTIFYVYSTCKEKKPRTREELELPTGRRKKCDTFFYPPRTQGRICRLVPLIQEDSRICANRFCQTVGLILDTSCVRTVWSLLGYITGRDEHLGITAAPLHQGVKCTQYVSWGFFRSDPLVSR